MHRIAVCTKDEGESRYPGLVFTGSKCCADESLAEADGGQGAAFCAIPGAYSADNDSKGCLLSLRAYSGFFCGGGCDLYGGLPEDGTLSVCVCGTDRGVETVSGGALSYGCDRWGDRGRVECVDRAQDHSIRIKGEKKKKKT